MTRVFFITTLALVASLSAQISSAAPKWQRLKNGLESSEIRVDNSFLFPPTVYLYRADLKHFTPETLSAKRYGASRLSAKEFVKRSGATLAINANYFDELGQALGLVVSSTKQLAPLHRSGGALTGIFLLKTGVPSIIDRSKYSLVGLASMAVQAGPRLIGDGRMLKVESSERARRAGVCIDRKQRLVFFIAPSSFRGITLKELQTVLLSSDIGCYDALNFDGGGSAQVYINGVNQPDISWQGQDDVPVAVGLIAR